MKENWEIKKLGEVCEFIGGGTPSKKNIEYYNGNIPWATVRDMKTDVINHTEFKITEEAVNNSATNIISKGNIVISTHVGIGKVSILNIDSAINQDLKGVTIKYSIDTFFLFYWFKSIADYIISNGKGATVKGVTLDFIKNIPIPIPPLSTQQDIVAELDLLHRIKSLHEQQLAEYDHLAQATFYHLFGDPIDNEKGWEVRKLGIGIQEMFLGPFGSALKNECFVPIEDSYCMVYEQKHAIKKSIDLETRYINKEKYEQLKRFEVQADDFIMSCRGTIGQIYRLPKKAKKGVIHPSLMKIRIKEKIFNPIFFEFLLFKIVEIEGTSGTGVKMAITAKSLSNKQIPIPPLSLQTEFAARVEKIELQKSLIKQCIHEVQQLIDYTMDKYFG